MTVSITSLLLVFLLLFYILTQLERRTQDLIMQVEDLEERLNSDDAPAGSGMLQVWLSSCFRAWRSQVDGCH